jgi:hypothetical protein
MPHYEFFCHDCKKLFSKILSLVPFQEGCHLLAFTCLSGLAIS